MSQKHLEIFYDYTCPYCYNSIFELKKLQEQYKNILFDFYPCEAHPKPEYVSTHSDLASILAYYIKDKNMDINKYNELIYLSFFKNNENIEDTDVLYKYAHIFGLTKNDVDNILSFNKYKEILERTNILVWNTLKFSAVPSYRCGNKIIGSQYLKLVNLSDIEAIIK